MPPPGATTMVPPPAQGRIFRRPAQVTLSDVDPSSRCRLDGIARLAQDIAVDDWHESGLAGATNWVARRTMIDVAQWPVLREDLERSTWCSGFGGRWAERRTTIAGADGAAVDVVTLWVHVSLESGRPERLGAGFFAVYGEAAGDRRVSARNALDKDWPPDAHVAPWHVRFADLDIVGHMNNAAQWCAVEEVLGLAGQADAPLRAELEHGTDVHRGVEVELYWLTAGGGADLWLGQPAHDGATVVGAGRFRPAPASGRAEP